MDIKLTWFLFRKLAEVERCVGQADFVIRHTGAVALDKLRNQNQLKCADADFRIDGGTHSHEEIRAWIQTADAGQMEGLFQQQAAGYYDVLAELYTHYQNMAVTENNIRTMHRYLMHYCARDETLSDKITAPDKMAVLLNQEKAMLQSEEIPPLLIAANFVYVFLTVHPFTEGNEKMSRLLTTLLLLKYGYPFIQYVSLEHEIEKRKAEYSEILNRCKAGSHAENNEQWLIFFLDSLFHACKQLLQSFSSKSISEPDLKLIPREQKILEYIKGAGVVQLRDIITVLDINVNTLKKDLHELVSSGYLNRKGKGRGTYYLMK